MIKRFAVMGHPVAHSLSPIIHQQFAKQCGIDLVYDKIDVELHQLGATVDAFFAEGGVGLNITLPFKEQAFALADQPSARCLKAKAANVLWMKKNRLYADNTDGEGLVSDLQQHINLKDKHVLILGAGGATRGIIEPLLASDLKQLTLTNRNLARALELQQEFAQLHCVALDDLGDHYDVVIHATSAGVNQEQMIWPEPILSAASLAYDLSYDRSKPTAFMRWVNQQGKPAIDGLGMLVQQAAFAFQIWHGVLPETKGLVQQLRQ